MAHTQTVETIIIGGGQAGLALSHCLARLGQPHLVLEQATQAGNAWRNGRWDSFTLVTPNWSVLLPDAEYAGPDPDGYMPRDALVAYFERYAASQPVRYDARVTAVEPRADGRGYLVQVETGGQAETYHARQVVVAAGFYQHPKIPAFSAQLPPEIVQLPSGAYRRPDGLPPGAVLVMGAGQSGAQIAEELYQAGRKVYLCVGFSGKAPRRYRGKDIYAWMAMSGFLDRSVDQLPSPEARFVANPALTGKDGGHALNLRLFARDGVALLGRVRGADGSALALESGLNATLARIDTFAGEICGIVDRYIERAGLDVPAERLPREEVTEIAEITQLDLGVAGVRSIIWAMGYRFDFSFVHAPVFDAEGYPSQTRLTGVAPGLYFLGLPWLRKQKSGLLYGIGEDAGLLANAVAGVGVRSAPR